MDQAAKKLRSAIRSSWTLEEKSNYITFDQGKNACVHLGSNEDISLIKGSSN